MVARKVALHILPRALIEHLSSLASRRRLGINRPIDTLARENTTRGIHTHARLPWSFPQLYGSSSLFPSQAAAISEKPTSLSLRMSCRSDGHGSSVTVNLQKESLRGVNRS